MAKRPAEVGVELEYRFDRLLAEKLARAYQLLAPEQRQPISPPDSQEKISEQTGRHLRSRLFGSPEGQSHDRLSDSRAEGVGPEGRVCRAG